MPVPVHVYDTGVVVVDKEASMLVIVQVKAPDTEEATEGVEISCERAVVAVFVQLFTELVTSKV
jgi:hypothetical protein